MADKTQTRSVSLKEFYVAVTTTVCAAIQSLCGALLLILITTLKGSYCYASRFTGDDSELAEVNYFAQSLTFSSNAVGIK